VEEQKKTRKRQHQLRIADLFANEDCYEAILKFLRATDEGRKASGEEVGEESSEASWRGRERRECVL